MGQIIGIQSVDELWVYPASFTAESNLICCFSQFGLKLCTGKITANTHE